MVPVLVQVGFVTIIAEMLIGDHCLLGKIWAIPSAVVYVLELLDIGGIASNVAVSLCYCLDQGVTKTFSTYLIQIQ
jgi:hypothetical protein